MKKYLLLLAGIAWFSFSFAQNANLIYPGDTLEILKVINFEDPVTDLEVPIFPGNTWQIGPPQKDFFNTAYSVPNAIVTDTLGFYPSVNHSWFDLYIGQFNMGGSYALYYPYNIFIDFRHKFDTDTLRDGGYLQVSWDKGLNWMNIISDTVYTWGVSPYWGWENINLYTTSDTLYNGEYGFSGHSNGWIHTSFAWHVIPVDHMLEFPPDTMIVRFNFISDADHHDKEGWMIDHIRLFAIDLGSGIVEPSSFAEKVRIAPNPMKNLAVVSFDKPYARIDFELYNNLGHLVNKTFSMNSKSFQIHRNNMPAGLYLCKILLDNNKLISKQVVLLNQ